MTARQAQLITGEMKRHIAMAKAAKELPIKCSHLEVAEALGAALQSEKGGDTSGESQTGDGV